MNEATFNPKNKDHAAIVRNAIHNADQFGRGRLSAVCEQLEMHDITFREREVSDYIFNEYVLRGINP